MNRAPTDPYREAPSKNAHGFGRGCEPVQEAPSIEEVARRNTGLEPRGGKACLTARRPLPDQSPDH